MLIVSTMYASQKINNDAATSQSSSEENFHSFLEDNEDEDEEYEPKTYYDSITNARRDCHDHVIDPLDNEHAENVPNAKN